MLNVQTAAWASRPPSCLRAFVNGYYQMPIRKEGKEKGTADAADQTTPLGSENAGALNAVSQMKMYLKIDLEIQPGLNRKRGRRTFEWQLPPLT